MRLLLVALLLANVLLVGYNAWPPAAALADPPQRELSPERIQFLTHDQAKKLAPKPGPRACLDWGLFTVADAARATEALERVNTKLRVAERRIDPGQAYWVVIPPQQNRREAELLLTDLKRIGGDDYYVVQEAGRFNNAISLGLFNSESGAHARREALARQGVRNVQVTMRETAAPRVVLRLSEMAQSDLPRIEQLRDDFAGADLKPC